MTPDQVTREMLVEFVYHEAHLLNRKRHDDWNALFTDDGYYWVPLDPEQKDPLNYTSHLYEDKLLRDIRVERLKSPRAFSQMPPARSHHLLQAPYIETMDASDNRFVTRTEFHYTESQGDEVNMFVGTVFHHLTVREGALKMTLKRINMLNPDAALPAIQLFI